MKQKNKKQFGFESDDKTLDVVFKRYTLFLTIDKSMSYKNKKGCGKIFRSLGIG
ncbi:MAG: hypothetical protein MJ000_09625 [Bacteroidales bacterium]|nr:hypothetical protein [Bacteroidales bacterium]